MIGGALGVHGRRRVANVRVPAGAARGAAAVRVEAVYAGGLGRARVQVELRQALERRLLAAAVSAAAGALLTHGARR